jgi:hypothetical protein
VPLQSETEADGAIAPGEAWLDDTPVLRSHTGTQPDLMLRWNRIPVDAVAIDVAVHLHGFSRQGEAMLLAEKAASSGLDLAGRARPTLALLPRGNWLRHTYYDFPALLDGGLDRLTGYAVELFSGAIRAPAGLTIDRLVLTAHSGGGMPAIDTIARARHLPDELHIFDGLYGRDPRSGDPLGGLDILDRWLGLRLAAEPARAGALRVVYIGAQTGPFSRALGTLIARHLASVEPLAREKLARRYRVEVSGVQHSQIARRCGPELLAAPDAEFDWWGDARSGAPA